jgi:hypothetical protein
MLAQREEILYHKAWRKTMSDINNPFQSPEANTKIVTPLVSQGAITDTMLKYLKDASPWLRFMGVVGFIGSGFVVLSGLIMVILMPFTAGMFDEFSEYFSDFIGSYSVTIVYATYLTGAGVLMFFPALFSYRFGAKIRNYLLTNSESDLELALKNNKFLWKFNGILMIIGLASLPVIIIIAVIIAVAAYAIF